MRFGEEQRDVRDAFAMLAADRKVIQDINLRLVELQKEVVYMNAVWWETHKRLEDMDP